MGLPGSGKTYLSERLQPLLESAWFNADKVRTMAGDWDFSEEGRLRQSLRMKSIADFESSHNRIVICDFVCPTAETRKIFDADITIWLDTIEEGLLKDGFRKGVEYEIMLVPNVVNITYGRGVGYVFEEEVFDNSVTEISATKIRKKMREEGDLK